MESEAGAAGAVHGSLAAGALTTTFTASQGLLLMIPNMYKIAGEMLPCVFDVSARTVATQSLNIFGDHSDVYACRQALFAMLCETNPAGGYGLKPGYILQRLRVRFRSSTSLTVSVPLMRFRRLRSGIMRYLKEMCNMEAVHAFRAHALNPEHPAMRGSHETETFSSSTARHATLHTMASGYRRSTWQK